MVLIYVVGAFDVAPFPRAVRFGLWDDKEEGVPPQKYHPLEALQPPATTRQPLPMPEPSNDDFDGMGEQLMRSCGM